MPYIVTTKRDDGPKLGWIVGVPSCSRRAVATLEEAVSEVKRAVKVIATETGRVAATTEQAMAIVALPESGGTVGPLPDGTVIEVEPKLWRDLVDEAYGPNLRNFLHLSEDEILAAFNTQQARPPTHLTPRPPQGAGWYGN
jgi:hypothetical protein